MRLALIAPVAWELPSIVLPRSVVFKFDISVKTACARPVCGQRSPRILCGDFLTALLACPLSMVAVVLSRTFGQLENPLPHMLLDQAYLL